MFIPLTQIDGSEIDINVLYILDKKPYNFEQGEGEGTEIRYCLTINDEIVKIIVKESREKINKIIANMANNNININNNNINKTKSNVKKNGRKK